MAFNLKHIKLDSQNLHLHTSAAAGVKCGAADCIILLAIHVQVHRIAKATSIGTIRFLLESHLLQGHSIRNVIASFSYLLLQLTVSTMQDLVSHFTRINF